MARGTIAWITKISKSICQFEKSRSAFAYVLILKKGLKIDKISQQFSAFDFLNITSQHILNIQILPSMVEIIKKVSHEEQSDCREKIENTAD